MYFEQLKELQQQDIEERKRRYNQIKSPGLGAGDFITETKDIDIKTNLVTETKQTPEEIQRLRQEKLKKAKKEVEDYKKIFEKLKSDDLKGENIKNANQLVQKF